MKVKNIVLGLLLLTGTIAVAQKKPKIKGSKTVIEVNEKLPPFNAINLVDNLKIQLQKSREQGYSFTGDDNLLDVLKFEVVDSTLMVSAFYKITSKKKLNIVINYQNLDVIKMQEGRIDMKDIMATDRLDIHLSGGSKLTLNAHAPEINITMDGHSSADLNTDADVTTINLKEKANLKLYSISEDAQIDMHDNANAKIEGSVSSFNMDLFGNTMLKAENYKAAEVKVNLDESADVKVFAAQTIDISTKGNSKTYLYGNPKISIIDFLDSSQLIKK